MLNRETMAAARAALERALVAVAAETGVQFQVGNGRYASDGLTGSFKLELLVPGSAGGAASKGGVDFARHAASFGLAGVAVGAEFVLRGRKFQLTGLNPKSRKYPVEAVSPDDGRAYKLEAAAVRMALGLGLHPRNFGAESLA
jgi:hypothetical protein